MRALVASMLALYITVLSDTLGASPEGGVSTDAPKPADYNAPEPGFDLLNHLRAVANLGFQSWAIWQLSWFRGADWVPITHSTLADNLRAGFSFDEDELRTNFFGHPYHGSLMFNAARGAGLGFFESVPYTFAGSLTWELFAENEPPSTNDLFVTTLAGILLGEMSYRLSSELLKDDASGGGRLLRELAGAAICPMRGFNRLYTGQAWRDGPPPVRYPVSVALHAGLDRVHAVGAQPSGIYDPTLLLALDIDYGRLLPRGNATTLKPLEYFDLYAAVNLLQSELSGAQIYASGVLYGWSSDISHDSGPFRDNHVFGFGTTYEFQSSNLATYAGVGVGPANYVVFRMGPRRWVRLGFGFDVVPIFGLTPSRVSDERGYNFGAGGALWGTSTLEMGKFGRLRLRSRQYVTTVLEGPSGIDHLGATRLSYEVDIISKMGVGIAPTLIYRRRVEGTEDPSTWQGEGQFYLRLSN